MTTIVTDNPTVHPAPTWPQVSHFKDADEIAEHAFKTALIPEDIKALEQICGMVDYDLNFIGTDTRQRYNISWAVMSLSRWVRNEYFLWHPQNPHTMIKHQAQGPQLVNGIDCSPYHPDNYSHEAVKKIFELARQNTPENKMIAELKKLGLTK